MPILLFSLGVAILYFGWLWHDRSARDCSEDGLLSSPRKIQTELEKPMPPSLHRLKASSEAV